MTQTGVNPKPTTATPGAVSSKPKLASLAALPGPPPMPVLGWRGNYLKMVLDPFTYFEDMARYGKLAMMVRGMDRGFIRRRSDGSPATVFVQGPEYLEKCLNTAHASFPVLHFPPPPGRAYQRVSTGLAMLHGPKHRSRRGMVKPAFHHTRFAGYRDSLVELTGRALDAWKPGEQVDLVSETGKILRLFHGRALLGMEESEGVTGLLDHLQDVYLRRFHVGVLLPSFPLSPRRRAIGRAEELSSAFDKIIEKRRASTSAGKDLFSMLLAARDDDGSGLSDDEVVGHLASTVFAAYDTMVHSIATAAYLLAQHPKAAACLHEELAPLGGAPPTVEQLEELLFLDGVVKETLRLVPAAPFVARTAIETQELGGYEIPPKTELLMSIYHTHRMPETYAEPNRFIPERWSTIKPTAYEYLPFSVGPHMCTGWSLALLEMKVMLAMFVQRFRLEIPDGLRLDRRLVPTVGFKNGLPMRVHAQDGGYAERRAPIPGTFAAMVQIEA